MRFQINEVSIHIWVTEWDALKIEKLFVSWNKFKQCLIFQAPEFRNNFSLERELFKFLCEEKTMFSKQYYVSENLNIC